MSVRDKLDDVTASLTLMTDSQRKLQDRVQQYSGKVEKGESMLRDLERSERGNSSINKNDMGKAARFQRIRDHTEIEEGLHGPTLKWVMENITYTKNATEKVAMNVTTLESKLRDLA